MRLNWKVFYNVLILRLTLGIGNLMSFHSPSASHVPLGTGRDKVGIRAIVLLLILNCRFVFSYTTAVIGCQISVLSSLLLVFCIVSALL